MILCKLFIVFGLVSTIYGLEMISNIKQQCQSSDPKLKDCIISNMNHLINYLKNEIYDEDEDDNNGEEDTRSVESLEVDDINFFLEDKDVKYNVSFREIFIYGASNFTVTNLTTSTFKESALFNATLTTPILKIVTRCNIDVELQIKPKEKNFHKMGVFNMYWNNVTANVTGSVKTYKENDETYIMLDDIKAQMLVNDFIHEFKKNEMLDTKNATDISVEDEVVNLFLKEKKSNISQFAVNELVLPLFDKFIKEINQALSDTALDLFYTD